jgi:hypothetical protein
MDTKDTVRLNGQDNRRVMLRNVLLDYIELLTTVGDEMDSSTQASLHNARQLLAEIPPTQTFSGEHYAN